MNRKTALASALAAIAFVICVALYAVYICKNMQNRSVTMSHTTLMDKIKGAWAGQVLGCTYGGPTEFRFQGRMIDDDYLISWDDMEIVADMMQTNPNLYDDIYMDLTFVGVFDRLGLDAPIDSLASAFAYAGYNLWHANQAARYNILRGIKAPLSGHWRNNPHADDIDYQIEADYAGIMSPGMPNTASEISDKVGHIMNYGNGWYGGVYMGAMYALAFVSDDIEYIVTEALKTIPAESEFYQCMTDVINIYHTYPDDWRKGWHACEKKWGTSDVGCGEGALASLNIDAMINSAYVILGLLYGDGDFSRTIDIATRCGQDSDCNPASAAGILGTVIGYSNIPQEWIVPLQKAEDMTFAYIPYTLNDTYKMSFNHALQVISSEGGSVTDDEVTICCQQPKAVNYEECFPQIKPVNRCPIGVTMNDTAFVYTAECSGILINGYVSGDNNYVAELQVCLDGKDVETFTMPVDFRLRRLDIYWNFELVPGKHTIEINWLNPTEDAQVHIVDAVLYEQLP